MVHWGIELAIAELHNQIATCPDVIEYADDIARIERHQAKFERLLKRIEASYHFTRMQEDDED